MVRKSMGVRTASVKQFPGFDLSQEGALSLLELPRREDQILPPRLTTPPPSMLFEPPVEREAATSTPTRRVEAR
jgi:hypothetical protein